MSLFGIRRKVEDEQMDIDVSYITESFDSLDAIVTESAADVYKLRAGVYISDILMEEAVLEGAAEPEILLESFGKGLWNKIKEIFLSLKAKIQQWYKEFKKYLTILFSSGEKFIEKFDTEIADKKVSGFKFDGFNYTNEPGKAELDKYTGKIAAAMMKYRNGYTEMAAMYGDKQEKALKDKNNFEDKYDTSKDKEDLLEGKSFSEVAKEINKAFRNKKDSKEEIELNETLKKNMVATIKQKNTVLKEIEEGQKNLEEGINKTLAAIKNAAGRFSAEETAKMTPYINHSTSMLQYCVGLTASLNKILCGVVKERAKVYEGALKGYLKFKPSKVVKDNLTDTDIEGESILEAAMKFI